MVVRLSDKEVRQAVVMFLGRKASNVADSINPDKEHIVYLYDVCEDGAKTDMRNIEAEVEI